MRGVVALFLLIAFAAACSGGATRSITPSATERAETPGLDEPTPRAHTNLAAALLTLADAPRGWVQSPRNLSVGTLGFGTNLLCGQSIPSAPVEAETGFVEQTEEGAVLFQRISLFPMGQATATMQQSRARMKSCTQWVETDPTGRVLTFVVSPLSAPPLGDETFSYARSFDQEPFGIVKAGVIVIRRGDVLDWVIYTGTRINVSDTVSFAQKAAGKLSSFVTDLSSNPAH